MSTQTLAPKATPVTTRDQPRGTRKEAGPGWLFIAPFAVFFVLFLIWPVIYMLIASMFAPPLVSLSFVFAVLANRVGRGQWFFRLAFFVPFILPSAAIALIWNLIYTPATGLCNSFQTLLGADA